MRFVTLIVFTLCTSFLYAQAEWPKPKWEKVEAVGCRHGDKTVTSTHAAGLIAVSAADGLDLFPFWLWPLGLRVEKTRAQREHD